MRLNHQQILSMHRKRRIKLVNGISGIQSANLIGSYSKSCGTNVKLYNSVMHLGNSPTLIGLAVAPSEDTYANIKETGYYTINHIHESFVENAHYTSADFASNVSKFDRCNLTEEYLFDFIAPFVGESKVKYGLKLKEEIKVNSCDTIILVGEITELVIPDNCIDDKGYVRLDLLSDVGIEGSNSYYNLRRIKSLPAPRADEIPNFKRR